VFVYTERLSDAAEEVSVCFRAPLFVSRRRRTIRFQITGNVFMSVAASSIYVYKLGIKTDAMSRVCLS
jgi:hypothetical protein